MAQKEHLEQFYLKLNGQPASLELMADIQSIEVHDALQMPDMFEVSVYDPKLRWVDSSELALGTEVEIQGRPAQGGASRTLIVGEVTAIEPVFPSGARPVLTVRGYDRAHRLHRGKKTRTFQNVSDSDLARQIAQDHHLQTDQISTTRAVHDYVIQSNQTDYEFLAQRARQAGLDFLVNGRKLVFKRPSERRDPPVELDYGTSLLEFLPRLTMASQFEEVMVTSWDPRTKRRISAEARKGAPHHETGIRATGPELAQQAFGEAGRLHVSDMAVHSAVEAEQVAQAICDELSGGLLQAEGTAIGNPALRAGCRVNIRALGQRFSGTYLVSHTRHVYEPQEGYRTHIVISGRSGETFEELLSGGAGNQRQAGGQASRRFEVVIGIVTNNEDPEGMGRVRVCYPWLDAQSESAWARLAAPMAGPDRGLFALPEIDDEVVVAFDNGDMRRPIVLGCLWNGSDKPPLTKDKAVRGNLVEQRVWKTRAGHTILLDDSSGKSGVYIDAGTNKIHIDATANEITVQTGPTGKVTVEAGGDVAVKSKTGKVSVEAAAGEVAVSGPRISVKATAQLSLAAPQISLGM